MRPRADFVCLSKKCLTASGEAPTYELPVDATRCPVCGSKRLRRLFNNVGVIGTRPVAPDPDWRLTGTSQVRRSAALLQDSFDRWDKVKASARESPTLPAGDREQRINMPQGREFVMPSRQQLAGMFGIAGTGAPMTEMEQYREARKDAFSVPALLMRQRGGIPTHVEKKSNLG